MQKKICLEATRLRHNLNQWGLPLRTLHCLLLTQIDGMNLVRDGFFGEPNQSVMLLKLHYRNFNCLSRKNAI